MEKGRKTNKILTILLIIGTVTVFFPLYMAVIIAFKNPNEIFQLCRSNASDRFLAFSWQQFTYHTCDNCARNSDPFHCRICNRTWYA